MRITQTGRATGLLLPGTGAAVPDTFFDAASDPMIYGLGLNT